MTALITTHLRKTVTIKLLLFSITILLLNSCYYKPFIGYKFSNNGFKKYNKREILAGDNNSPQRDYHINRYDWAIEIFPKKKRIAGKMVIQFTSLSSQDSFLFDLQNKLKITSFSCSNGAAQIKRVHDLFYLIFEKNMPANTRFRLSINYEGKPANLMGEGPIQWKKDEKKRTWISTSTEGIGPQFIMPCNALLRAEPDSTTITVTVPIPLTVVANGRLTQTTENTSHSTKTYKYEVTNPINIYNISFNIGHFVKLLKPYIDNNGAEREIECQVLDYNKEKARDYYNQVPIILKEFEQLFGVFPWWNDGCKFVESTFSAMEHQSAIAMGSDYRYDWKQTNTTLVHELAHEWWGNNVTGYDYCDIWIHEGIATYSEALFIEKIYGKEDYTKKIHEFTLYSFNSIPIHKKCNVLYNSWANFNDQDIYSKGALLMHSLRYVVNNDDLFFSSLLAIQKDFAQQNISTEELIMKFNTLLGNDYSTLFNWYLYEKKPPILHIYVEEDAKLFYYKWDKEIPFFKDKAIDVTIDEKDLMLVPTTSYQSQKMTTLKEVDFLVENTIYYKVKKQKTK